MTKFFEEVEELDVSEGRCHRLIQHLKKQVSLYEIKDLVPSEDLQEDCKNIHTSKLLGRDNCQSTENYQLPCEMLWNLCSLGTNELLTSIRHNYNYKSFFFCIVDQEIHNPLEQSTTLVKVENAKRKNDEQADETGANKHSKPDASVTPVGSEQQKTASMNKATESIAVQPNNMRNSIPYFLPNMPFFPTMCVGANGTPQYQPSPQTQFPGYPFLQSGAPYIPVALPQLPYIGLNFMSGFGMMNTASNQQQNQGFPGNNIGVNGFAPSIYTNGIHANLMSMRHHDSGYDSSDKSSSMGGCSQSSPQPCSDDSYST